MRKIVDLHGGQVSARSAGQGSGSQFEVLLPLVAPPGAAPQAAPPDDVAGLRLLLVDDNVDAAAAGAALLEFLGHEVRVAHTAGGALDAARQRMPQVAILDISRKWGTGIAMHWPRRCCR